MLVVACLKETDVNYWQEVMEKDNGRLTCYMSSVRGHEQKLLGKLVDGEETRRQRRTYTEQTNNISREFAVARKHLSHVVLFYVA